MTPLVIAADLGSGVMGWPPQLDGLLAAAVAVRDGLPPMGVQSADEQVGNRDTLHAAVRRLLAWDPAGFYLCSEPVFSPVAHDRRYINRRAPLVHMAVLGAAKFRRIETATGTNKSYRIPQSIALGDAMTWFALGDAEEITAALAYVTHLGKRRGVGCGAVRVWRVAPAEPWAGFPVLRDGRPMRALPLDYPGVAANSRTDLRPLAFPYWEVRNERSCFVP